MNRAPTILPTLSLAGLLVAGCVAGPQRDLSPREVGKLTSMTGNGPNKEREVIADMNEREMRAYIEGLLNEPIEFHGRAQTRDGQPLEGAGVRVLLFDKTLPEMQPPYVTGPLLPPIKTDRNGQFRITKQTGGALLIHVEKDGFQPVNDSRRFYYFGERLQYRNKDPLPSAEMPAVFILEDTDLSLIEDLFSGSIPLPETGAAAEISLRHPTPYGVEPDAADLRVTFHQGEANDAGRYDWSCDVSAPGGGIQFYSDIRVDLAPEEGYEDSVTVSMDADDPNWKHREEYSFLLKLRDGNYAFIEFKVRTKGDRFFVAEGTINIGGERFLK